MRLPPPPWIVGHRGAAGEATENTMASVALAVAQGADLVEVDVQLAADGVLVAFHDWDLARLTDLERRVEDSRWAEELSGVPLGAPGGQGRDRIATLVQVLAVLPETVPLVLELKRRRAEPEAILESLAATLRSRAEVLFSSFDWELLAMVRTRWPAAAIAPLGAGSADSLIAAGQRLAAWSLHCPPEVASASLLESARRSGRTVMVYTVNDADQARALFERGVAGVFTDFPGRLRSALAGPE
ncbi:MAG: glycerophosphodiester phosphodiesterase [Thermoanaerobaculia bacterium]